jgi:hypothetical protein
MPNPSTPAFAANGASGIVKANKARMVIAVTFMAKSLSSFAIPLHFSKWGLPRR